MTASVNRGYIAEVDQTFTHSRDTIDIPDLTDFLYQRDREIIAFARPDLAVTGTGLSSAAQVVDIRAMSAA